MSVYNKNIIHYFFLQFYLLKAIEFKTIEFNVILTLFRLVNSRLISDSLSIAKWPTNLRLFIHSCNNTKKTNTGIGIQCLKTNGVRTAKALKP